MLSVLLLSVASTARLETGDLIFVQPPLDTGSPLDDAILATGAATIQWLRYHGAVVDSNETAVHVAVALRDPDSGELSFVEAVPPAVQTTPADVFFRAWPERTRFYHGGFRNATIRQRQPAAAQLASKQMGRPYANNFGPPPNQFYCSSLVDWAYRQVTGDEHVLIDDPFTLIFVPHEFWKQYYADMNSTLPANVTGSNPTLLLHSPHLQYSQIPAHAVHWQSYMAAPHPHRHGL